MNEKSKKVAATLLVLAALALIVAIYVFPRRSPTSEAPTSVPEAPILVGPETPSQPETPIFVVPELGTMVLMLAMFGGLATAYIARRRPH